MMARNVRLGSLALLVGAVAAAAIAFGQDSSVPGPGPRSDTQGMMTQQQWLDQMRRMGMSDAMIMRCRMMNATQIDAYDPASVLAYQTGLGLSEQQVSKIQEIAAEARQQVKAVLNQEQTTQLAPLSRGPQSITQMCQWMMQRAPQSGGNWTMMCPMMMSPAATQPTRQQGTGAPQQGANWMMNCPMRCW